MGPNDPYARPSERLRVTATPPTSRRSILLATLGGGALVGVVLGLIHILFGLAESLTLLFWIGVGTLLGWVVHALFSGQLDLAGAYRALWRKE